ncbi:MAG: flagellar filament capping protein FliD [Bacillota bacterium]|jgi:flagellar hook-associated protein 2
MQVLGIGSGMDVQGLIDQLLTMERQPVNLLTQRNSTYQKQVAAWSEIKTRLVSFKDRIADLRNRDNFNSKSADSSSTSVATVSCGTGAATGVYHLKVDSLAMATKVESSSRLSPVLDPNSLLKDAGLGIAVTAGTVSINGVGISVDPETESLNDVLTRISANVPGVSTSYNSETGKVVFNGDVQLGSGGDTSNFFKAIWVDGQTGSNITSAVALGTVQPNAVLDSARFSTPLAAAGSFEINGVTITYDGATDTLNSIIERINNSDAGVTAGYNSLKDTMILTAKATGSMAIDLKDLDGGNLLQATGLLGTGQVLGANARYCIEEISGESFLTSTSNKISEVIPGVDISLVGEGDSVLTVDNNPNATINKVKGFTEQYNSLVSVINSKLAKDAVLQGDSSLIRLNQNLRRYTTNLVSGLSGDVDLAGEIGLEIDAKGVMTIDESKLREMLASKPAQVYDLFNSADGIANRLEREVDAWVTGSSGIIPVKEDSLNRQIEDVNKSIESMEARLEQRRQLLVRQFTAMDKALASMNSQSTWLAQQLASLPQASE